MPVLHGCFQLAEPRGRLACRSLHPAQRSPCPGKALPICGAKPRAVTNIYVKYLNKVKER